MLKIDLHTHTIASGHAFNTIYEMAKTASQKGVKILGITDHGPAVSGSANELYFEILGHRAPRKLFNVRLLYGVELNILNKKGKVDLSERYFKRLDFLSAGLHKCCPYKEVNERSNTIATINAMKNPYISIFTHVYLLKCPTDVEKITQAACDSRKLLEISTINFDDNSINKECIDRLMKMIKIIKRNNFKVLLSSDAHCASEIAVDKGFRKNMKNLGLNEKDIANNDIKYLRKFIKNI